MWTAVKERGEDVETVGSSCSIIVLVRYFSQDLHSSISTDVRVRTDNTLFPEEF